MNEIERPILFLDIDGTVRWGKDELGHFPTVPDDVKIFDEVVPLLAEYRELGWAIVGVSNQGGVATGHTTVEQVAATMDRTNALCNRSFNRISWCPHYLVNGNRICWCRKPGIGLLLTSISDLSIQNNCAYPPYLAFMAGDREEDAQCAQAAGIGFMWAKEWRAGAHLARLYEKLPAN